MNTRNNLMIAGKVKHANTLLSRTLGLMFIKEMKGMDALLLEPCNSIHNFFVRFSLDVVFLNKNFEVVKVIRGFKPWRMTRIYFKASKVLELPAGSLIEDIRSGDKLEVRGV